VFGELRKTLEPARHAQFAVDREQWCAAASAPGNSTMIQAASIIAATA
jgi:hypothetical protein